MLIGACLRPSVLHVHHPEINVAHQRTDIFTAENFLGFSVSSADNSVFHALADMSVRGAGKSTLASLLCSPNRRGALQVKSARLIWLKPETEP